MPTKIKLFFIFVAVLAVVSVFSFFDVVGGVRSAFLSNVIKPLPGINDDTDNDGLFDTDESYWNTDFQNPDSDGDGFIDGEEVASRHDPTIAGPLDKISDLNLTQKVSDLAAGGLMEGSLKPDSPNYVESLDALTLSVIDDGLKTFTLYPEDLTFSVTDSSSENQQAYLKAIEPVWKEFFESLGEEINSAGEKLELTNDGGFSNEEYIYYFIRKRDEFNSISKKWRIIPVPSNWQEEHANFSGLIQNMTKINEALAKGKDDPVRAAIALNLFINLVQEVSDTIKIYSDKAKAGNIPNELFN